MVKAITGRARLPRFTSGVATRAALRASGARAATTGTTLHLPAPPDGSPRARSVVAHELSHVRDAVRQRTPASPPSGPHRHGRTRSESPHFLLDQVSGALGAGELRARAVGSAVGKTAASTGSDIARTAVAGIESRGPSVSDLPVGGLAPVLARATAVARQTAAEVAGQAAPPPARADGGLASDADAGRALLPTVPDTTGTPSTTADRAEASGQAVLSGGASAALQGEAAGGGAGLAGRADELMEILEDRLIAELERRGGRFAGVF